MTDRPAGVRMATPFEVLSAPRSGLEVRPFRAGDDRAFAARPDFAAQRARHGGGLPCGLKWTLTADGTPRAVGGVEPLGGGAQGLWGYAADLRPREWWLAGRFMRMVGDLMTRRGFRVVAKADPEQPGSVALLAKAGFAAPIADPHLTLSWKG